MEEQILFSEKQYFRQWWLWLILIFLNGIALYKLVSQTNKDNLIPIVIQTILTILFLILRLETQIKSDGIYVRFFPFHLQFKHYTWNSLSKLFVRSYSPIGEYGGWGIRGIEKNRVFNISGNEGLKLEFPDHKKLLIGTMKSELIVDVLTQVGQLKR
ncbi:hypothetical protein QNI19_15020 [Cytophagaceae bacterium DM2B3-1]|uniref:PH domain-containing protein n=1 Tax=Xanthocytophaga flava TaxID=3048013 RepID=A0ABT7CKH0_9BACT|nr:hypothetical protein [Xanthocytophaga flavus]MDJ1494253.1 hypothetical protein [Xanthocytophaga flavus]